MYKTSDFDFDLPSKLIADQPLFPRDSSRMAVFFDNNFSFDKQTKDLVDYLEKGDVIVFNDTKVIKAKLIGRRNRAKIEINLHKNIVNDSRRVVWEAFAKPAKRLNIGDQLVVGDDFSAQVVDKMDNGIVVFNFSYSDQEFAAKLEKYGLMPLPPYIKRPDNSLVSIDEESYQTVYAKNYGAVAAPTAGLHFTEQLLKKITAKGIITTFVTLNVGAGTFLPVKSEYIADHPIHSEYFTISEKSCDLINSAKKSKHRIIAVGTTSLRVLESAVDEDGVLRPYSGNTQIFIYPPFRFRIADVLLTNFHLPKSTLIMLVSAFIGKDNATLLYKKAVENNYRFYSYGDCCLLERTPL